MMPDTPIHSRMDGPPPSIAGHRLQPRALRGLRATGLPTDALSGAGAGAQQQEVPEAQRGAQSPRQLSHPLEHWHAHHDAIGRAAPVHAPHASAARSRRAALDVSLTATSRLKARQPGYAAELENPHVDARNQQSQQHSQEYRVRGSKAHLQVVGALGSSAETFGVEGHPKDVGGADGGEKGRHHQRYVLLQTLDGVA